MKSGACNDRFFTREPWSHFKPLSQICLRGSIALGLLLLWPASAVAQNISAATAFTVSSDWGSGANATLTITNTGTTAITNRQLEFDFAATVTPYNNVLIVSHGGTHYTFTNQVYYSQVVAPGATFTFDMGVAPGNLNGAQPTNYLINGLPLTGTIVTPALSVADASAAANASSLSFPVSLSRAATGQVSVAYSTLAGTATSQDFIGTSGTLFFTAGTTQQVVNVQLIPHTAPAPDKTFSLLLTNASGATLARAAATGTLIAANRLTLTNYPDWRAANNIATNVSDSTALGGDHLSVLWKYVLALNPNVADATNSPLAEIVTNGALKYTYPRYRPDIAYRVRTSDNLTAWTTNGISATTNGYLVTASVPAPVGVNERFLSLGVKPLTHTSRFLQLYANFHNPTNGYFSTNGIPYHSIETLICEAPDYGHETTSEAYSYYFLLEAMYGRLSGDWNPLATAWTNMESYMIPTHADQPANDYMTPSKPATYAPEWELPSLYPARLDTSAAVGADPLYAELKTTYGTSDLYAMHWILDVDNWYGYGRRGDGTTRPSYFNTFQRGKQESVWETVPQPSWDNFNFGGTNGFLDLFTGDSSYTRQWRYTDAPDADARAIQAIFWAKSWADAQGGSSTVNNLVTKASQMGDCLRYALFDKYFRNITNNSQAATGRLGEHYLLSWYYAWGGSLTTSGGWAWRIGASHSHFGYQNPLAAWALGHVPGFIPASPTAQQDWTNSLHRQLEFYCWLQSSEGAIAGGATSSYNGRYETPPAGTSTFYGMAYQEAPVYEDPPSNQWFGMQAWSMERLAEYYYQTGDPLAKRVLDKWTAWALSTVQLPADGTFAIPSNLSWSGQPDTWNATAPGTNASLHVTVTSWGQDVGITASLARTLFYYSAATKQWSTQNTNALNVGLSLLDRLWTAGRDTKGVSIGEQRADYSRFFEQAVYTPPAWTGKMANGDVITNGVTFLGIRSKYKQDPAFPALQSAYNTWVTGGRSGAFVSPVYRYHRFWAQVEVALANATYDLLFPDE